MNRDVEPKAPAELFNDSINRATLRQLSIVDLIDRAATLSSVDQKQLAVELYKTWMAYNADHSFLHAVYFNYGVALMAVGDRVGAINAYRESIRLKPDFYAPYINLGGALEECGQAGMAVTQWLEVVNNLSTTNGESIFHKTTALHEIARILENSHKDSAAEDALKQSLDIKLNQPDATLDFASSAAVQMAGDRRVGSRQSKRSADWHFTAVARISGR
jgi:predicted O-linked N-acetylglucosamine transferase (SPINDLY family)